jgi:hypothetical protein
MLALDRLSTHPEENFFGFVRWDSNDINTADQMLRTIAHTDLVTEARRNLGLEEEVHKRVNLGGVHYDDRYPSTKYHSINMPSDIDPEIIASICLSLAATYPECVSDFVRSCFQSFVEYLTVIGIAEKSSQRNVHGQERFICGSGSRIINAFHWHESPIRTSTARRLSDP